MRSSNHVDQLYSKIEVSVSNLKQKGAEEIDFSQYYDEMKDVLKNIVKTDKTNLQNTKVRYILLAFSLEIFNSTNYYDSFWNTVYKELETDKNAYRAIFDALINLLEKRLNIRVKRSDNSRRLLVYTLRGKVEKDNALLDSSYQFFMDYFIHHRPKCITEQDHIASHIEEIYAKSRLHFNSEKKEFIINFTEDSTKAFHSIIEEHSDEFENEDFIRQYFADRDVPLRPFRGHQMTTVLRNLLNRVTPHQFHKELLKQIDAEVVLPDGAKQNARLVYNNIIDYGEYIIRSSRYQVTPNYRIGLSEMKRWSEEIIAEYRGVTYYKKHKPFNVNGQTVRHFADEKDQFYVWCGSLPIGKEIVIDGNVLKKEGFTWLPKLRMMWGKEGASPILRIETGNVIYYSANNARKELKIHIGEKIYRQRLNNDGFVSMAIGHEILSFVPRIEVLAELGNGVIKRASFSLDEHMLFSGSTRDRIQNQRDGSRSVSRIFGESNYYLFSRHSPAQLKRILPEPLKCALEGKNNNIEIVPMNGTSAGYYTYQINWFGEAVFHLSLGDYEWKFTYKKYLNIFFNNNTRVYSSVRDLNLFIEANVSSGGEITYQLFNNTYETIAGKTTLRTPVVHQNVYNLHGREILEDSLDGDLIPGEYIIEVRYGDLYAQSPFYIIPSLVVQWPDVIPESEWVYLSVQSEVACLKQSKMSEPTDRITISLRGKVWENRREKHYDPEDISLKVSLFQPQLTTELIPPKKIFVFGFRLFLRNEECTSGKEASLNYLNAIQELDYYNLNNAEIHLFSRPGDLIRFIIDSEEILQRIIPESGTLIMERLQFLSAHCVKTTTMIVIQSSYGYKKTFKIFWHPRVFALQGSLNPSVRTISSSIKYIGPEGAHINLTLSDPSQVIEDCQLVCNGSLQEAVVQLSPRVGKKTPFYYIQAYNESFNNTFVSGPSVIIYNELSTFVTVSIGKEKEHSKTLSVLKMDEDLKNQKYTRNMLSYIGPIWISYHGRGFLDKYLLMLYNFFSQRIYGVVIVPTREHAYLYENAISLEKSNNSKIFVLRDARGNPIDRIEAIVNPIQINDLFTRGLGISSYLIDNPCNLIQSIEATVQRYTPRPRHIVILEAQELNENEKKQLLSICTDRTLIFIERDKSN